MSAFSPLQKKFTQLLTPEPGAEAWRAAYDWLQQEQVPFYRLLHSLASAASRQEKHSQAVAWAQQALESLFQDLGLSWVPEAGSLHTVTVPCAQEEIFYSLVFILSISVFYDKNLTGLRKHKLGAWASDLLLFRPCNQVHSNHNLNNLFFYLQSCPCLAVSRSPAMTSALPGFYSSTPCLLERWREGVRELYCNVRYVNYAIDPRGNYLTGGGNHILTKNRLFSLDAGPEFYLEVTEQFPLEDHSTAPSYPSRIQGQEDMRLFSDPPQSPGGSSGPLQFLAVDAEANPQNVICLVWGEINDQGQIIKKIPLRVNPTFRVEKNWLPFYTSPPAAVAGEHAPPEWFLLYSFQPLTIYRLEEVKAYSQNSEISTACPPVYSAHIRPQENLSTFRGGSAPLPFTLRQREGWLMVIHQVYYDQPRKYAHRFVWLSADWQTLEYSTAFFFQKPAIEYCTACCLLTAEIYLLGYSLNDGATEFRFLTTEQITKTFG